MYAGGQYLESYAERAARREMTALLSRVPRTAIRHRDGRLEEVALELIVPGDRLLVRHGDVVPVDGTVVEGVAVLDQSALTGESLPVQLRTGDPVLSGSTNVGDAFDLTATRLAAESTYAGVIRLVEAAQRSRAPMSRLADRYAIVFLAVTVALAARGLAHDRRRGAGGGGAGGGDALSADPGGAGGDRRRPVARGQARHSDQGRQGDRDAGADPFAGARQDRHADPRPGADRVHPRGGGHHGRRAVAHRRLARPGLKAHHRPDHRRRGARARAWRWRSRPRWWRRRARASPAGSTAARWLVGGLHYVAGIIGDAASALLPGERLPGRARDRGRGRRQARRRADPLRHGARRHRASAAGAARARHRAHRAGDRRPPRGGGGGRHRPVDRLGALGTLARRKGSHGAVGAQESARS